MLKYKKALKLKRGSNQYKLRYRNHWLLRVAVVWLAIMLIAYILSIFYEKELLEPIISPLPETKAIVVKQVAAVEPYLEGMATWYGTGETECLGCRKDRIMANGQVLDDKALTVACGVGGSCKMFPLGSRVKIINTENGMTVYAVVTDTGGFQQGKYAKMGRILDVTKAVRDRLNMGGIARVRVYHAIITQ